MKILITGSTGLLGQALTSHLAQSCEVAGLSRHARDLPGGSRHVTCDLRDAQQARAAIHEVRPDILIHAQALSDVDRCEREPEMAWAQNVTTVAHLVQALQGSRTLLVYVSTDYVFDGKKGAPYEEADAPNPLSVYGRSKLEGERLALGYARSIVVRPSTLFGPGRDNFCDAVVCRVRAGQPVEAFWDQVTSPTYTVDLAEGIGELSLALWRSWDGERPRRYHLANGGGCTRAAFAERIVELVGGSRELIRAIAMADQRRPAARPAYSALATRAVPSVIGRRLRSWDHALHAYLHQRRWLA
ncbi:MAG: dTDP-4-dehydrorhamnose reductase [Candidatus Omnitrophota bacterium]|nr:dTDP-4-dehydrorhamnose reductase [Candidatus Omnitrophota bacterium]